MKSFGEELREQESIDALKAEIVRLHKHNAKLKDKHDDLMDAVNDGVKSALLIQGIPKPVTRPGRDRRKGEEIALIHFTDWQLGKKTVSYNSDVCVERVERAVQKVVEIAEIQRADHPVRKAHVILGGDLIENVTIFKKQAWEVDSGLYDQLFRCANLVASAMLTLLEHFEQVTVDEVWGNHGRIGQRDELPHEDNLDRVIGRIARQILADQGRLEWREPEPLWHRVVEIGNYRALLFHGDQVRGGGGQIPAYGIAKRVTAWATGVTEPFLDAYCGHYHQDMKLTLPNGGRIFMTPSTESDSEFARAFVAAKGRPGQRLHFVNPRKGEVTGEYVLWLD